MTLETTTVPAVPAVKLTRRETLVNRYTEGVSRIAALTADIQKFAAEIATIDALADVDVGSVVVIGLGVGPTARDVTGAVAGVRTEEDGTKSYKVTYGVGFDADVATVKGNRIKQVIIADAAPVEAPAAE